MAKKVAVWGGAGVALLLIIGGVFLFLGQKKDASYTSIPTTWSQEGDYEIKTEGIKTTVTNKKAGYSFEVPEGWKVEKSEGAIIGQATINLSSSDSLLNNQKIPIQGCVASFETIFQEDAVFGVNNTISSIQSQGNSETEEVIKIGGFVALKESIIPDNQNLLQKSGEILHFSLPLSEKALFDFWMRFMPKQKAQCISAFDRLINSFKF